MQRRSLAILAAMVMGVSALAVAAPASAAGPPDGAAYVALGDSDAAGTGNLPYVDGDCLRSRKAYPNWLARMLGTDVVSVACAGATTGDVIATQVDALGTDTRLVTITVGVNNLDWLGVLRECSADGDPVLCAEAQAAMFTSMAALPADIAQMLGVVRMHAPNAQILVAGYPLLFGDLATGSCRAGSDRGEHVVFSAEETQFVNGAILTLNQAIAGGVALYQAATGDPGVTYVDVTEHFDGHGLCDTEGRWVSGVVSGTPVRDRGLHLNPPGMREYAEVLAEAISG
ncbi:MAG: SGNH/GDSL hydrolase family protein [Actinomycetota bacterium]